MTLRFEYLSKDMNLDCEKNLIPQKSISRNLEKISQLVGVEISEEINMSFSKSNIYDGAVLFFTLNSCPSFLERLYWNAIYGPGPTSRIIMLASNIIKKAKFDSKETEKIFAKISSVLGFQHIKKNETREGLQKSGIFHNQPPILKSV